MCALHPVHSTLNTELTFILDIFLLTMKALSMLNTATSLIPLGIPILFFLLHPNILAFGCQGEFIHPSLSVLDQEISFICLVF